MSDTYTVQRYKIKNASIWQKMYFKTLENDIRVTILTKEDGKKIISSVNGYICGYSAKNPPVSPDDEVDYS